MDDLGGALLNTAQRLGWVPDWAVALLIVLVLDVLAWWLHRWVFAAATRLVSEQNLLRRSLVARTRQASRLFFLLVGVAVAVRVAPLSGEQAADLQHLIPIGVILLTGWSVRTALYVWTVIHLRRFKLDSEDNLLARKHATQARILQQIANVLIVLLTASASLMTFDDVRQYGVSLLASAGVAGIVLGFALQPLLKNLVAGVQLAVTQPIRIDDALLIEGEWGNVEEITATYVVVRLWDWRRFIIPLSYFLEKPFQNWTREGSALIGTVFLYTDFPFRSRFCGPSSRRSCADRRSGMARWSTCR
jgi:small-conductance mechanosensitive channel